MSDSDEPTRQRKRYAKRLAFGYALTCLSAALFLSVVIGMAIQHTNDIFSGGACSYRVVWGLLTTAFVIEAYMIIQEWCTYSNIKNNQKRYGCHKMSTHQFFMHCIILLISVAALGVDVVAHPNVHDWIVAIAGFAIGLGGINAILRLALISSERERQEDTLARLKAGSE